MKAIAVLINTIAIVMLFAAAKCNDRTQSPEQAAPEKQEKPAASSNVMKPND